MEGVQYQLADFIRGEQNPLADFIRGEQNPLADSIQSTACLGNEGNHW